MQNITKKNKWKEATYILLVIVLICSIATFFEYKDVKNYYEEDLNKTKQEICGSIKGTPAWFLNGSIEFYGYNEFSNFEGNKITEFLIPTNTLFIYNEDCGWCKKQISFFGEDWKTYQKSGLTINCKEYLS